MSVSRYQYNSKHTHRKLEDEYQKTTTSGLLWSKPWIHQDVLAKGLDPAILPSPTLECRTSRLDRYLILNIPLAFLKPPRKQTFSPTSLRITGNVAATPKLPYKRTVKRRVRCEKSRPEQLLPFPQKTPENIFAQDENEVADMWPR